VGPDGGKVAVLGAGSWGTTVAALLALDAHREVVLWARSPSHATAISEARCNDRYLPNTPLPHNLAVTADIGGAVAGAGVVVVAVPARWVREVLVLAARGTAPTAVIVNLAKGFEPGTLCTMSEVCEEVLPGRPVAVLTGPNLAPDIAAGLPAAAVVACREEPVALVLQQLFSFSHFRVYTNDDVVGCEVAGGVKNVLALAAGMADGLEAGDNARAALVTRGLAELSRLGVAMGGHAWTFAGLAGLGDVVLSCTSRRSRNWAVGFRLAQGEVLAAVLASTHQVAEGVGSAPSVVALAARYGVVTPICEQVAAVVAGRRAAADAVAALLERERGHERAGLPTG
jgi:glycerol-3-phosphate dehydrogenase (NAD(P)+)